MDPRTQARQLQIELIHLYSRVRECRWGLLLYNLENPTYYEANGARQIRTDDPEAAIAEIVRFYRTRRLTPRVIVDDEVQPPDMVDRLEAHGFECGQNVFRIMTWQGQILPPELPDNVRITVATHRDVDALVAIQAEDDAWSSREWLRRRTEALLAASALRYYLAWQDAQPVAMALHFQSAQAGLIENVVTHPCYRRRGLGSALIQTIQADAETPLLLEVENAMVERFYARLGFEVRAEVQAWQCWLPAG